MKISLQVWAFVLCLGVLGAFAQSSNGNSGVSCSSFAALVIRQTDVGRCTGIASANCEAVASAQTSFVEAYDNWFADDGLCDEGKAAAAARACATAMASVYVDAIAKVTCSGRGGFACGWAASNGNAWGISFARALAQASVDIGGDQTDSFCFADVESIGSVLAEAAADSQAQACVNGEGSAGSFESDFVVEVANIIAEAFAIATGNACSNGDSTATTGTQCVGGTNVDATPGATTIPDCNSAIANNCCSTTYSTRVCSCSGCDGPLVRQTDYLSDGSPRTWRRNSDNSVCKCP